MTFKPLLPTLLLVALIAPVWAQAPAVSSPAPAKPGLAPAAVVPVTPASALPSQAPIALPAPTATSAVPPVVTPGAMAPAPSTATQAAPPALDVPVLSTDPTLSDPLGGTTMREAAKLQALTDLEDARAKLDAARFARVLAQQKFAEQLGEAKAKADKDTAEASKAGPAQGAPAAPVVVAPPEPKPYATSYYDFNGRQFARVTLNGTPLVVSPGDTLPDGTRVLSIDAKKVVLRRHGARVTVPYLGSSLGLGN